MQFVVTCWWEVWGSVLRWKCHRILCAFLHRHPPRDKVSLSQHSNHLHPLEVLEHSHVDQNVFRWVVFVLWLEKHPHSYHWYQKIERSVHTLSHPCSPCCFGVARHGPEKEEKSECLGEVALEIPPRSYPRQFGRREPIHQGSQASFGKNATHLGTGFGLHFAQTQKTSFSHLSRHCGWVGRSMSHRFGGSSTLGQV